MSLLVSPPTPPTGTVPIIDDEMDIRDGLAELIRDAGIPAVTAKNGHDSLAYLQANEPPKLILLDLVYPNGHGLDIQERLQADPALAEIPVVVLSGMDDVQHQASRMKVDGYMRKPVDPRMLLEVVTSYCRSKSSAKC